MRNKAFEKLVTKGLSKSRYRNLDTSRRDILAVLAAFRGLAPDHDSFVFDDGTERSLVNINGTIPVAYKGSTYNIPVCFWLLDDYPTSAPMAFVKPTLDMQIRASDDVDLNGRVTIPYIQHWSCPASNLLELVRVCTVVFGQAPPVFTKPRWQRKAAADAWGISRQASLQHDHPPQGNGSAAGPGAVRRSYSARESETVDREKEEEEEEALSEEHVKASVLSAAEQKVRRRLEEEYAGTHAEIEALHSTTRELLDGQERVAETIAELQRAEEEADERAAQLAEAERRLQGAVERLAVRVPVDELVVVASGATADIQHVEAVAEDAAVDDAVYALGRALQERRVECDVYLRKVRELSRRQFKLRAIMAECERRRRAAAAAAAATSQPSQGAGESKK